MAYKFNPFTGKLEEYGPVLTGTGTVSAAADGTAGSPGIAFANDLNTGIYRPGSDQIAISTGGTARLFVDSSGNVGIGTSSPTQALSVVGSIQLGATLAGGVSGTSYSILGNGATGGNASGGDVNVIAGAGSGSGVNGSVYISAGSTAGPASVTTGGSVFITSGKPSDSLASGTIDFRYYAGNPSTLATAMRIDSSGRVGIGTTSPQELLHVNTGSSGGQVLRMSTNGADTGYLYQNSGAVVLGAYSTRIIGFETNGSERARIDSSGRLLVGTSTPPSNAYLAHFNSTLGGGVWAQATGAGDSSYVSLSPGNTVGMHYVGLNSAGTIVYRVNQNGDVRNTNNSYGAISDIKLKENIVDANSQWDDLKALQVRNYNLKEGQTHTQIGLVAQEVELVSPGLVSESPDRDPEGNDLGTVTKSVNYSVLYMKAVKALQEAMERIETLEAKVAALEAA